MRKLTVTKAQAAALALIEDNPRRVEAVTRLDSSLLRVNGNVETTLQMKGWVERVELGEHARRAYGKLTTVTLHAWRLTESGREALRSTQ